MHKLLMTTLFRATLEELGEEANASGLTDRRALKRLEKKMDKLRSRFVHLKKKAAPLRARLDKFKWLAGLPDNLGKILDGEVYVLAESEREFLEGVCKDLCLMPAIIGGTLEARIRSRYTVSKDCDVDEVGWDDPDPDDWVLCFQERGQPVELANEQFISSPGIRLNKDAYEIKNQDYDGDHHGMWAVGRAVTHAWVVVGLKPVIHAMFESWERLFLQGDIELQFSRDLPDEPESAATFVDVTQIAIEGTPKYDGVSMALHRYMR